MDDRLKESISALMDDEANEIEVQRVLSQADNKELIDTWQRYHRVRDTLKANVNTHFQIDVSKAVSKAIMEDVQATDISEAAVHTPSMGSDISEYEVQQPEYASNFLTSKKRAALSLVASVAFALFFVIQGDVLNLATDYSSEIASTKLINPTLNSVDSGGSLNSSSLTLASNDLALHQPIIMNDMTDTQVRHFNKYLLRHAEHLIKSNQSGFLPLARVASVNAVGI